LPFKANYGQDPRIGFERRKKGKYEGAEKFVENMKEIQEKAKTALSKAQEKMKKYADRKYHKWSFTICDGCFDTSKSSKMRSKASDKRCC